MLPILFATIPPLPLVVVITMALMGIAYASSIFLLQKKLVNQNRMRELQQRIKDITKEMQEMAKRKEDVSIKQKELMPLMNESMKSQFKSMFVVLPLFFVIYYLAIPNIFAPFNGQTFSLFSIPLSYTNIFFVAAFVSGLIFSFAMQWGMRRKAKSQQSQTMPLK